MRSGNSNIPLPCFLLIGGSVDMGSSSWIAASEAKKCNNGVVGKLLQESFLSLRF